MKYYIQIDFELVLKIYKSISNTTHKGNQGHSLLIGGSYGKMGFICLSSRVEINQVAVCNSFYSRKWTQYSED